MANTNLIIPNAVEGNISSCKTELTVIGGAERESIWYVTDIGYATNNCTGQTDMYESWSLSGVSVFMMVMLGIVISLAAIRVLFD